MIAHCRRIHAVTQGGRTTTLDMTQNRCTGINAGTGLDLVCDLLRMADALGHDDDEMTLAGLLGLCDLIQNIALHVELFLRQQNSHSTRSDGHVQCNITGIAAHDLDHTAAVMALGGVAQLIDHFQRGIHRGIVADGIIRAGNIVIDGAGQADHRDAAVGQLTSAAVRTITANDHQCIDPQLAAFLGTLVLTFLGLELQAAGSVKDRTACRNDVRDTAQVHFKAFTVQQAVIAALNADHTVTLMQAGTDYGAHSSVHAGSITAACQHTNRFDLLFHTRDSLQFCLHLPSNITALSISTLLRALHLP